MGVGHRGCLEGHSRTLSGLNSGPQMCEQIIPQTPATMGGPMPVVIPPHHDGLYFQIRTHRKPTLPWVTYIITRKVTYSGTLKDKVICIRTIGKMPWKYFRTWQGSTHFRFQCIKLQTHLKNCPLKREVIQVALFKTGNVRKCFPGSSFRESEAIAVLKGNSSTTSAGSNTWHHPRGKENA